MPEFRLATRARLEILDIVSAGVSRFGSPTSQSYLAGLYHLFELLARNPRIGRAVPDYGPNAHRHPYRRHVVFYDTTAYGILILRIVPMKQMINPDHAP